MIAFIRQYRYAILLLGYVAACGLAMAALSSNFWIHIAIGDCGIFGGSIYDDCWIDGSWVYAAGVLILVGCIFHATGIYLIVNRTQDHHGQKCSIIGGILIIAGNIVFTVGMINTGPDIANGWHFGISYAISWISSAIFVATTLTYRLSADSSEEYTRLLGING